MRSCTLACLRLLPHLPGTASGTKLDVAGAITVTTSLMLAVYAIVNGHEVGWRSTQTVGTLAGAVALLVTFLIIESRVKAPLMPLGLFRLRNVATANVAAVLWAAAMFAWFFISALYLQLVLGYNAMQVGLSFLPANLIMAAFSLGLVREDRHEIRLAQTPRARDCCAPRRASRCSRARRSTETSGSTCLPGMTLLGIGAGIAFNPLLLGAMSDVSPADSGLASGIVNTAFMMGGALGLAVLASIAAGQTDFELTSGVDARAALNAGYRLAFLIGAICAAAAGIIGGAFMRTRTAAERAEQAIALH